MNMLQQICASKEIDLAYRKINIPHEFLVEKIADMPLPMGFLSCLKTAGGPAVIAEIKKAAPGRGVIREDFDPIEIAQICRDNGVTCLSVCTDKLYFQGLDEDLICVREAADLPILHNDFMLDPYQIYESRALGADCVLLIMAALEDSVARLLYETAINLQMDVLVEVHNLNDLERALHLNPDMIAVINRCLKTLTVDLNTSYDLLMRLPDHVFKISGGGIDAKNLACLYAAGYEAFMVGENLMQEADIGLALQRLIVSSSENAKERLTRNAN